MSVNLKQTSGPVLEKAGDLAALLTNLEPHDVLFVQFVRDKILFSWINQLPIYSVFLSKNAIENKH